ncbi:related to NTA1 - Amidase [Ustilago trichophora]|uniref:Related to NTA1 - Amidase n=1 Tax=Ustilago trichophora TaxID=86804 RepID=A0A5C3EET1_9BASI|nr:related to NTA1 - Amidase [Ustilago trichophora]
MSQSQETRIACVQFDSKHADVAQNTHTVLNLVTQLISDRDSNPIHLVVLPELALTGYVFTSRQDIDPLLEDAASFQAPPPLPSPSASPTSIESSPSSFITACIDSCASSSQPSLTLASHLAQQLHCYVVIGFPERSSHAPSNVSSSPPTNVKGMIGPAFDARPQDVRNAEISADEGVSVGAPSGRAFNSAALLAPDGSLQHVFRKHFLFDTDRVWASEGGGFEAIHLPTLGNVCVAICMDLNPFEFRTPFESCELASFCVDRNVDLLVMPMAWLLPKDEHDRIDQKPSLSTINYWAMRCMPFFDRQSPSPTPYQPTSTSVHTDNGDPSSGGKMRYLVTTNRAGTEATSTFAGSSCVLQMKPAQRPLLLDCLGASQEACLVVSLPP